MNESIARNLVGWFEIYVQDIERAKAFYRSVFATQFTRLENPGQPPGMELWAFPVNENAIGVTGALVKMPGVASGGNSVIVYFMCPDCAATAAKAEQAGGRIHMPKTSIGQYGHIALVIDTEGILIGLHSMT
jgi:predicted enzyme related to lactoylglutathione lyase